MRAWQRDQLSTEGLGGSLDGQLRLHLGAAVASVRGEDAGFGCPLCGRVPLPQLPTRRIEQVGESKAIASW